MTNSDTKIQAFNGMQRWYHKHIIHFMFFFIITGLPVFSESFSWIGYIFAIPFDFFSGGNSVVLADGLNTARMIHRLTAFFFVLSSIPFIFTMLKDIKKWQIWPEDKWTISALIDGFKQVFYTYSTFKHSQMGKYNVAQKLMAWAIIGSMIGITLSGFGLMFRGMISIELQEICRSLHAICFVALAIMLIVHIYFSTFPMNRDGLKAMFGDGTLTLEQIKHHHPLWYKKIISNKKENKKKK
ncbi:cytochrome b/b6 domain-containing protein [Vibrio sp. SS-MA-C1-2]|uniref:cytochrome b/b6 domain-containing protein n=1 Tax=Vibrio sp. SS-MA-C1-2 TaxID=2908646 RepID=UPI001F333856|nr:cytochrome b/b6 domain-containing protein [Vibrio sp. SS-MA-C1-2]UJF18693.1 cytochrome b/b6 domain-containing protein [Vibrio sp. SS-MA-C1-2]